LQSLAKGGVEINNYISHGDRKPYKGAFAPRLADQYIIGDRIKPAQERLLAAILEPADTFDDANKYFLRQILCALLVAHARMMGLRLGGVPGLQRGAPGEPYSARAMRSGSTRGGPTRSRARWRRPLTRSRPCSHAWR